jgi:hypothetical protein
MPHSANLDGAGTPGGTVVSDSTDGFEPVRGKPASHRAQGVRVLRGLFVLALAAHVWACALRQTLPPLDLKQLSTEPAESPMVKELGLRRLDNDEIKTMIVGRTISLQSYLLGSGEAVSTTSATEVFTRYLTYINRGDFGTSAGQYQIIDNMICITFPAKGNECRRFYTDSHGVIYQDYMASGSNRLTKLLFGKVGDSHRTILPPPAPAPMDTRISGDTAVMTIAPTHLRKLSGSEIQRLLAGRTLSYVLEPGVVAVSSQYRQTFLEDGSVVVALDRANKRGRYRVHSDQLCVVLEPEGREECSQLFVSTDTHYYIAPIGSGYIKQKPLKIMIE